MSERPSDSAVCALTRIVSPQKALCAGDFDFTGTGRTTFTQERNMETETSNDSESGLERNIIMYLVLCQ